MSTWQVVFATATAVGGGFTLILLLIKQFGGGIKKSEIGKDEIERQTKNTLALERIVDMCDDIVKEQRSIAGILKDVVSAIAVVHKKIDAIPGLTTMKIDTALSAMEELAKKAEKVDDSKVEYENKMLAKFDEHLKVQEEYTLEVKKNLVGIVQILKSLEEHANTTGIKVENTHERLGDLNASLKLLLTDIFGDKIKRRYGWDDF